MSFHHIHYKIVIIFFLLFTFQYSLLADKGGPDKFGYTWKDSREPDGPKYSWFEIPANTDRVVTGLGDDNVMGPFPIGGKFIFYWYPVDKFWVGANGYIGFKNVNIASPFPTIPDSTTQKYNFIAPLMNDLNFAGKGNKGKVLYHITKDSLIVSYINVPFWAPSYTPYTGSNTFQIILNRADKSITFNYKKQIGPSESTITVGIENLTGSIGLQTSDSLRPEAYSIKFYYPDSTTFKISDGGINWNTSDGGKGFFMSYPSGKLPLVTDIINFGNQNIENYSVSGKVTDPFGKVIVNSEVNVSETLLASDDTIIRFPVDFTPEITGSHSFITKISGVMYDKFSSDDTLNQEIVSVDTSRRQMNLTYAKEGIKTGTISWQGGVGGVGMYFKPPVYPAKLVSTDFVIVFKPDTSTFYVKIYDDKGLNGMPGNLIDSVLVETENIQILHKTVVPVKSNIIIYSGGVYVSWVQKGDRISLAVDMSPPFSKQTFEVLSGTFAQYRDFEKGDFFIGLNIEKSGIDDIGVSSISNPVKNAVIKKPVNVSCWIKNYGQVNVDTNFVVRYSMDYGNYIEEHFKGNSIKPGDSALFTFSTPLYTDKDSINGYLCIGTRMQSDYSALNDSVCIFVKIYNTTGIEELIKNNSFSISPNPVKDKLILSYLLTDNTNVKINLYSLSGNKLIGFLDEKQAAGNYRKTFSLPESLSNGIYLVKLQTVKEIKIVKLVKL